MDYLHQPCKLMARDTQLLAKTIHQFSTGDVKDQMFYLICLKFVLRLDQKIYKLNPSHEFLGHIRSLEALIDRYDINPNQSSYLAGNVKKTMNPVIVGDDQTSYNTQSI